jgi:guanylate kinase
MRTAGGEPRRFGLNETTPRSGIAFVLSAPSGTGKTTLSRRLLARIPNLRFSVSYTTRERRRGERDGVDYHFVSPARFKALQEHGEFLEWTVLDGACYGTSRRQIERALRRGEDLLLDVDTKGAAQIRRRVAGSVLIFLLPPDLEALRRRHRRRGTDEAAMRRRIGLARREVVECESYDYLVLNERLGEAARDLEAVVRAERCRTSRRKQRMEGIQRQFGLEPRPAFLGGRRRRRA